MVRVMVFCEYCTYFRSWYNFLKFSQEIWKTFFFFQKSEICVTFTHTQKTKNKLKIE